MITAHVLQHVPFEDIGSIRDWLRSRDAVIGYTRFYESWALPDLSEVDLVIVMGGPMSVNDEAELAWLRDEKEFLRQAIDRGVRVLGICLGAQLIASALGCRVYRHRVKEIGWFPIDATPEGVALGLPSTCDVFHWHGETFELPPGAVRLASTPVCENQAFQVNERTLGLQFHLEATPESVRALVAHCADELVPAPFVQSAERMLATPHDVYQRTNRVMETLLAGLLGNRSVEI